MLRTVKDSFFDTTDARLYKLFTSERTPTGSDYKISL